MAKTCGYLLLELKVHGFFLTFQQGLSGKISERASQVQSLAPPPRLMESETEDDEDDDDDQNEWDD